MAVGDFVNSFNITVELSANGRLFPKPTNGSAQRVMGFNPATAEKKNLVRRGYFNSRRTKNSKSFLLKVLIAPFPTMGEAQRFRRIRTVTKFALPEKSMGEEIETARHASKVYHRQMANG